uniref:hypothetical protein n=1 Tax=unclassified Streptomyces TaxID=2593676 RepID=UPI003F490585
MKPMFTVGAQWLANAHPVPAEVKRQWLTDRYALLPAGQYWDAVALPSPIAASVLNELTVTGHLAGAPVLWDHRADDRSRAYVLVPAGTAADWQEPPTYAVGVGGWVVMPKPTTAAEPVECSILRWEPAPDGTGRLVSPDALRAAVHRVLRTGRPAGGER